MSDSQPPTDPAAAADGNAAASGSAGAGGDPPQKDESKQASGSPTAADGDASKKESDDKMAEDVKEPEEEPLPDEVLNATVEEIQTRTRLLDNDIKVMRSENMRLMHEQTMMREKIKDNSDKIKQNKVLPYLVGNVVEVS